MPRSTLVASWKQRFPRLKEVFFRLRCQPPSIFVLEWGLYSPDTSARITWTLWTRKMLVEWYGWMKESFLNTARYYWTTFEIHISKYEKTCCQREEFVSLFKTEPELYDIQLAMNTKLLYLSVHLQVVYCDSRIIFRKFSNRVAYWIIFKN